MCVCNVCVMCVMCVCRDVRRSAPKVKFSKTVTEFSHYNNSLEGVVKLAASPGQSPSHSHHGNKLLDGESLRVKGESSEHNIRKSTEK